MPLPLAALLTALKALGPDALGKALDPAYIEGFSPSAGLTVAPLTFSSVEQEGRWKIEDWGYETNRRLSNKVIKNIVPVLKSGQTVTPNPANTFIKNNPPIGTKMGATTRQGGHLLTITVKKQSAKAAGWPDPIASFLDETILQNEVAEIIADWQYDDLEIWGGFAGLGNVTGFRSVWGHRASVQLSGTVFGNYLPGSYLIAMTGYINPIWQKQQEFRCAVVIRYGEINPLWALKWNRYDAAGPLDFSTTWSNDTGFQIVVTS